jgi:cytochrome c oxidase cbb3-type subunit 3
MSKKPTEEQQVETTGHSWDGIEEYNNPLPRWWLWTFYATILWGVIYMILFPAWPLVSSATSGILGFSTRGEFAKDIAAFEEANKDLDVQLAAADLSTLRDNADLHRYAVSGGGAVFKTWCSQCHGQGGGGAKASGYPNLTDDSWLWGGTIEDIHTTISHGIRNEEDDDARYSEMPAFGEFLEAEEIEGLVNYVLSISGQEHDKALASSAAVSFEDNCVACHGESGEGDVTQGAPNLTDAIWLYGGDADTLRETIANSRYGVMPAWSARLSESQVKAVAAYVHQLGGGE